MTWPLGSAYPAIDASSPGMESSNCLKKVDEMAKLEKQETTTGPTVEADVDIDLGEVYFLIMHFLSAGPCRRTYGHFLNELLEHQLLPRRYHAWYSRSGLHSGYEDDNGLSFPLSFNKLVERHPHIKKDHLIKLLKQLILNVVPSVHGMVGGNTPSAANVPTLLGSGFLSLLDSGRNIEDKKATRLPIYLRWPHMQADQVRGLSLREIGGGFGKHHRAPSIRAACYAIAKPSTMVQNMEITKKLRGHRAAVYCATFDRLGRYVITGSDDRLVKIWSMETAFCLSSCRGHEGDITDLAVSSNNALVASSSNDYSIRVWRLPDGLPISILRGHTAAVTAIAFSPRAGAVYQLLSSSDDGTCRIWDARHSQFTPRVYIPKPLDTVAGKGNGQLPSTVTESEHRIVCCVYNANGTVFVTGSSDNYARVWSSVKCNLEDSNQPIQEIDILSGHENVVNYVQFSGCAVPARSSASDTSKEENLPKLKNSWFAHDNIVTCSRDGSAIIWIPRSRKSHGKVGRWIRAYHLKVPPPPLPPRGGPRQRFLPTPRGVNMIVWSLDNRFVLAAITDSRICVWNAADGSLVHSLTGHSDSTYVLDVHPFNPRIAMSAGYDGKTIVWDIWDGAPVRIYETGHFKLVDGKFAPDGTSILLSDDVGQIYILASGQGESHKAAMYDQFFLGDYRPLIQDGEGNVLDQETQLAPYVRNIQDLLCDSSMIPYPEPYQNNYQQRRLGALGIEWRPSSIKFSTGPVDYQMFPLPDLDRWVETPPEFVDAMDWEQENEAQSDDADSEYNVPDEYASEAEQRGVSACSISLEHSSKDSEDDHSINEGLRRSKRKKLKAKAEFTISQRRLKRRNSYECDGTSLKNSSRKKLRHTKLSSKRRKTSTSKSLRPQRLAARNALNMFSRINGASVEEDGQSSESDLSKSGSASNKSYESDTSLQKVREKEAKLDESGIPVKPPILSEPQINSGRRRLVLKLNVRNSNKVASLNNTKLERCEPSDAMGLSEKIPSEATYLNKMHSSSQSLVSSVKTDVVLSQSCGGTKIRWRHPASKVDISNAHVESGDLHAMVAPKSENGTYGHNKTTTYAYEKKTNTSDVLDKRKEKELAPEYTNKPLVVDKTSLEGQWENRKKSLATQSDDKSETSHFGKGYGDHPGTSECQVSNEPSQRIGMSTDNNVASDYICNITDHVQDVKKTQPIIRKIKIKSKKIVREPQSPSKLNLVTDGENWEASRCNLIFRSSKQLQHDIISGVREECDSICGSGLGHGIWNNWSGKSERRVHKYCELTNVQDLKIPYSDSNCNMYNSVETSRRAEKLTMNEHEDFPCKERNSSSKVTRHRKKNSHYSQSYHMDKRNTDHSVRKPSWLMLPEHEESYRYIPQQGDEVAYLIQGHQEYIEWSHSREVGPWISIKGNIKAVEFCKVEGLDYSTLPGSGESCCKIILKFMDPSSEVCGTTFKLTLPELIDFSDFIVERMRYIAAIRRNWTHRDKCQVWWRNDEEGGNWWEGRIMSMKPKSPEFPDSPWERYVIQYKSDTSKQHLHSPWELHDLDSRWEHPHLDKLIREKLLYYFAKMEQKWNQDYGFQKLKLASQKSDFLNRFAVPLSLELIKKRIRNNYYRSLEAVKHDTMVMLLNAKSYFGKNVELTSKMQRLSDRIMDALSSL